MTLWYLLIILVVGLILLWLINRGLKSRRGLSHQDQALVTAKWREVEKLMEQGRSKEAIFDADKLLYFIFRKMNFSGETFADRLKAAEKFLPNYQDIWGAHKLRNKLAHEIDFQPSLHEAQQAIATFARAIRKLNN